MIVVDASVIVEILLNTQTGIKIANLLLQPNKNLVAPELLAIETINILRKLLASKELTSERAELAFQDFTDLLITYYSHQPFLPRVWELRNNFTAYDATYLALAEVLDSPLYTSDAALMKGKKGLHSAKVVYLSN